MNNNDTVVTPRDPPPPRSPPPVQTTRSDQTSRFRYFFIFSFSFFRPQDIVRDRGLTGLFRGLTMTVAREMPSYFCFFGVYEAVREALKPAGRARADCGPLATTAAGAAGGMLLWTVTFPVDVVKSRIQLDDALPTRGWTACMARVFRDEGLAALYSGLAPTLVRCVPSSAVLFVVYEYTRKMFGP